MKKYFMLFTGIVLLLCFISNTYVAFSEEEYLPLGTYDGFTYTNEYIGLGCTLEGWRYDTLAELATRSKVKINGFDNDLQEMIQKSQAFILMYAEPEDQSQSIAIAVSYGDGFPALVDLFGMETITEKVFPVIMEQYISLYGQATEGRIISREIDGKTFYGYMINLIQGGKKIFWEQLTTTAGNYIVTITASASSEEIADNIYDHFFLTEGEKESAINIENNRIFYTGQKRAITFYAPENWLQGELRGTYNGLEVEFVPPESKITQIQYACKDLFENTEYPDSMRQLFSMDIYTEESLKQMMGDTVSELSVEKKTIGLNEWFIIRGKSIVPIIAAVNIENGYLHQFTLLEADVEQLSIHENDLISLLRSVEIPID